jgi:protein N-terminal methyltransferase
MKISKRNKKIKYLSKKTFRVNNKFNLKGSSSMLSTKNFWDLKKDDLDNWYIKAIELWNRKPATIAGVLDNFDNISQIDLDESAEFLGHLTNIGYSTNRSTITNRELRALDCGAGVGRITESLLIPNFDIVDLVEPANHFIEKAKMLLSQKSHKGEFYERGLQDFIPIHKYDCIWIQWVLGQLTDDDIILFLKRCSKMLTNKGVICVKENIIENGYEEDTTFNLITRNEKDLRMIFLNSGLQIVHEKVQKNWPDSLTKVKMFCLVSKV